MKPFSALTGANRSLARNAALLNLFATPGLGSLLARQWIAGAGQLALALAGFAYVVAWFLQRMHQLYAQLDGGGAVAPSDKYFLYGSVLFGAGWCWSLLTSLDLLRQAGPAARAAAVGNAQALTPAAIFSALATVPQWTRREAVITRTFQFADFPAAMKFVHAVAELAEAAQHHPDVDIRWNRVMLALTTHDAGGLTERDFALARACDALA